LGRVRIDKLETLSFPWRRESSIYFRVVSSSGWSFCHYFPLRDIS
jgi:hypothetical protein